MNLDNLNELMNTKSESLALVLSEGNFLASDDGSWTNVSIE
ncbi:hypothetical protein [Staphylococcus epidermidis]|nr:hypothetical protein [Staphylococcus epidermidis]